MTLATLPLLRPAVILQLFQTKGHATCRHVVVITGTCPAGTSVMLPVLVANASGIQSVNKMALLLMKLSAPAALRLSARAFAILKYFY
jgi:mRNA-degrading endonuclease toxin of MazEF toxin-antitoxin module